LTLLELFHLRPLEQGLLVLLSLGDTKTVCQGAGRNGIAG